VQNVRVTEAVKHLGLCYMPDPSSQAISTIGGNVAENSGGVHCLKYGVTSNHVVGLEAVLPSGDVVHLGGDFVGGADREFDLTGAVIGSEGLLAIITEITVRLVPQPLTARILSLGFRSVEDASKCVGAIIGRGIVPAGLEFIDRKVIDAVSSMLGEVHSREVEAILLRELDGSKTEVDTLVAEVEAIAKANGLAETRISKTEEERAQIWQGRKLAFGAMGKIARDIYVTKRSIGGPVLADAAMDMSGLAGIDFYEPEELVIKVRAGTPVATVRDVLAEKKQHLAFEPPAYAAFFGNASANDTMGGIVACNLAGPRRILAGAPRDAVLGVEGVNGRGESFKGGGRTVKNVTGYDMPKLMTGSFGILAALTSVTLKVQPAPPREITLLVAGLGDAKAIALLADLLNVPAAPPRTLAGLMCRRRRCGWKASRSR